MLFPDRRTATAPALSLRLAASLQRRARIVSIIVMLPLAAGCAASKPQTTAKAEDMLRAPTSTTDERRVALDQIWTDSKGTHEATRERMKSIAWRISNDPSLRLHALELLRDDPQDPGNADTRKMFALMLPSEPAPDVVAFIARAAVAKQWTDLTPALVRAWARPTGTDDPNRSERAAILTLNPGKTPEQAVFAVYATPITGTGMEKDRNEGARSAAWHLLSRLDPSGDTRRALLAAYTPTPGAAADAGLDDLRAAAADLGILPMSANQLSWLREMRRFDAKGEGAPGAARQAWWTETTAAVARLTPAQRQGLAMRHLESVRAITCQHPEWLTWDRAQAIAALGARLKDRKTVQRTGVQENGLSWTSESFDSQQKNLSWADAVTVLLIDDVLQTSPVRAELWKQVERDLKNTATELGGLLEPAPGAKGVYTPVLYSPRPASVRGDDRYVAPEELFLAGGMTLAHYHFHAQRLDNHVYAGPGPGDMDFAADQGRACIVVTPIGQGKMNIDYYQLGDVTIDLGVFKSE
ncbi:hypothetical protein BH11PLA1_BH11PLA1_04680 [soil metagenome]